MVEVFKTNIEKRKYAKRVLELLNQKFSNLKINLDLEDCDNILRVKSPRGEVDSDSIIDFVSSMGLYIEVLPDYPHHKKANRTKMEDRAM